MPPTAARPLATLALLALGTVLSGCFTTAADFQHDAETFILENDELESALFADTGISFVSATCEKPENQDVDTTFPCTGTDSEGRVWEFEVSITSKTEYEVNISRRPDGA